MSAFNCVGQQAAYAALSHHTNTVLVYDNQNIFILDESQALVESTLTPLTPNSDSVFWPIIDRMMVHSFIYIAIAMPKNNGTLDVIPWGNYSTSLWCYNRGIINRRQCSTANRTRWIQCDSIAECKCDDIGITKHKQTHTMLFIDVFDDVLSGDPTYDQIAALVRHRRSGGMELCMSRETISYVGALFATVGATRGTISVKSQPRSKAEFYATEKERLLKSLEACGGHAKCMGQLFHTYDTTADGIIRVDVLDSDFTEQLATSTSELGQLKVLGLKIIGMAPLWTRIIVDAMRFVHRRNLTRCARTRVTNSEMYISLERLGREFAKHLEQKYNPPTQLQILERAPIVDIERIHEAMPMCMRNLHDRATGKDGVEARLRYSDRMVYQDFMLSAGATVDDIYDIQYDFHETRLVREYDINAYSVKIAAELNQLHTTKSKIEANVLLDNATTCNNMATRGLCPYDIIYKFSSCSGFKQAVLKSEKADKIHPRRPLVFTKHMRIELDEQKNKG